MNDRRRHARRLPAALRQGGCLLRPRHRWPALALVVAGGVLLSWLVLDPAWSDDERLQVRYWSGTADFGRHARTDATLSITDRFCVAATGGAYLLTLHSAGGGDRFALSSGWNRIPYEVWYADNGVAFQQVPHGKTMAFATDVDKCKKTGANTALRIDIRPADLNGAETGVYLDVLTAVFAAL